MMLLFSLTRKSAGCPVWVARFHFDRFDNTVSA